MPSRNGLYASWQSDDGSTILVGMMPADLVVIATYSLPGEAEVAASVLDAEGIECMVERPFIAGARPNWLFGGGGGRGVRLVVRAADAERAIDILGVSQSPDEDQ